MKRQPIYLLIFISLFLSCKRSTVVESINVDPGFSTYVSAFTSGVISSRSQIRIILTQPVENIKPNQAFKAEWLSFQPEIKGQAVWQDAQTIVFTPSSPLPSGKNFQAQLKLSSFTDVPSEYASLVFSFRTIAQSLHLVVDGLQIPEADRPEMQSLQGHLRTNDETIPADIKDCLQVKWGHGPLKINWEQGTEGRVHPFTISGIERQNEEQFLQLKWDGSAIGASSQGEKQIRIPPLGEFTVQQINVRRLPQLHFEVYFSDPIDLQQELDGLVYLESGHQLRLEAEGNVIRAFPSRTPRADEVVHVHESIVNSSGNTLQEAYIERISFSLQKPNVERIDDGVIMPSEGQALFPFRAINLKAVNLRIIRIFEANVPYFLQQNRMDEGDELSRVGRMVYDGHVDLISSETIDYGSWNEFAIDLSKYVEQEPGAIYRVMIGFEPHQSLYPCGDEAETQALKKHTPIQDEGGYHYNNWRWYEGYYDWDERDDPCSHSYFIYHQQGISANLISSSLGIIAKQSAGEQWDVAVSDLKTTKALGDVHIELLNFQNQSLGEGTTNSKGISRIKSKGVPYLIVAKLGKQKGYLRVDPASSLSTSLFETSGTEVRQGVKGFIYGERGVWRPGDTLHLSFMLEDEENAIPPSHPVVLELSNPRGQMVQRQVQSEGVDGLYAFHLPTSANDPTGSWRAKITVGAHDFYKSLKVETIKPNRLSIDYELPERIEGGRLTQGKLTAQWLYGAPGANLDVRVETELYPMNTRFDGYEGFGFDDRSKRFYKRQQQEITAKTNSKGKANIDFNLEEVNSSPGMLDLRISTKVFEPGGDFSQDFINRPFSPYSSYVGLNFSGGENWSKAINTEDEQSLLVAAVDPFGKPVNRSARLEVHKLSWHWWWEGQSNGREYINMNSSQLILEEELKIDKNKKQVSFKLDQPTWGLLLIKVIDNESGHSASQLVFAEYPYWSDQENAAPEAAAMLNMETDKERYLVGEEAEIRIPSGGTGKLWITIEKGDRILQQYWVEAEKGSTKLPLEITEEMSPNVYVAATLIQPHGQDMNSLPIRMYGVIPVHVEDPNTRLSPTLKVPQEVRPESTFTCEVKEANGKPMSYTLAVVDEGLLSLTRFQTPDPWEAFHQKEALGVRTWDLYRYVMNAQTAGMTPLLATGGDESLDFKDLKEVNRFKAVVRFLGPFALKTGERAKHDIHLPNYIGAVRVMVVAGKDGAYGNAEEEVQVKQPLMLLSTLPRVLGPSETVEVPVQLMSMDASVKSAKVKISTNEMLEPIGETEKSIAFSGEGEKMVYFRFKVAKRLGEASLKITAEGNGFTAKENVQIAVRAPNPVIGSSDYKMIEAGEKWNIALRQMGIRGTNAANLSVSLLPDLGLEKQLEYLIRYPHGCIEQTTSAAFPQVFLERFVSLDADQLEKAQSNVQRALNRLLSFQTGYGGFAYWPGNERVSTWGTNYAGHFMLEAEKAGYTLPAGMRNQWLRFQKDAASRWTRRDADVHYSTDNDLIQAYRLYTLALAGEADMGAMNRLKSDAKLSAKGSWRLAAAYALIGRNDAARELISLSFPREAYRELGHTYGSNVRDLAMAIETLAAMKEIDKAAPMMVELAKELNEGWHSTQTRAYSLVAFARILGDASRQEGFAITCTLNGQAQKIRSEKAVYLRNISESELAQGQLLLENRSDQPLFAQLYQSGIPLENSVEDAQNSMGMEVRYTDMQGQAIDVASLEQGTDFKAIVTIQHPNVRGNYEEMALEQLFPSGWQIVNKRLNEGGATQARLEYQDIRDDRVYSYFDLAKGSQIEIEVLLNATFCGDFYLPAVSAYAMYDESISAVRKGRWVKVNRKAAAQVP